MNKKYGGDLRHRRDSEELGLKSPFSLP